MRSFGHSRPVRDENGKQIDSKPSPVRAVTVNPLGGLFGVDKERRLIVTLAAKDLITLKPHGTRREVSVSANDVYRFALQCVANKEWSARALERKAKKAERLARQRQATAERRLFDKK